MYQLNLAGTIIAQIYTSSRRQLCARSGPCEYYGVINADCKLIVFINSAKNGMMPHHGSQLNHAKTYIQDKKSHTSGSSVTL